MDTKFLDPPNLEYFKNKLKSLKTDDDIHKYIKQTLPGWIEYVIDEYSSDYGSLCTNWDKICEMIGTKRKKIVLVNWISNDDDHKLLSEFCEVMTRRGYVVRRLDELFPCKVCGKAIPDKDVWERMKKNHCPVPEIWSDKCSTC